MNQDELIAYLETEGYTDVQEIPNQGLCGVKPMIFTVGLFCGLQENGYKYRYCYPNLLEAMCGILAWDGTGHPDGDWIKRKGQGGDVFNPAMENEHVENS